MIGPQQWGFDAVYTPLQTRFLTACQQAGLATLSGFDLWVFQGIDAFNIFTGSEVRASKTLLAYARSLVS
jgi:shikimate dehydrogenase